MRICVVCGKEFEINSGQGCTHRKTCSKLCSWQNRQNTRKNGHVRYAERKMARKATQQESCE